MSINSRNSALLSDICTIALWERCTIILFTDLHCSIQYLCLPGSNSAMSIHTDLNNQKQIPGFTSVIPPLINQQTVWLFRKMAEFITDSWDRER